MEITTGYQELQEKTDSLHNEDGINLLLLS